ncbi:MAG TPA: hypothetical protein VEB86_16235, partial [Chryseosolibacter sp.]|nr:hypothetical protein [Chryseosolibacter sp.]
QLTPVDPGWSSYFSYYKELSNTQLFFLKVVPYFKATQAYLRELSLEQNLTYKFTQNWSNYGQLSYWPTTLWSEAESVDVYQFSVYTSGQSYNVYYRQDDGTLHAIKEVESNTYIYSGADFDKYDAIKFVYEAELDAHVFVDADSESPRYESVPAVPADTFVVSNYSHDPVTGILTFDFTISVSGTLSHGNRINSSKHDVTIEGTFNSGGKLYESVVGRKRT